MAGESSKLFLTPIGIGGAFSGVANNSWYMVIDDIMYIFDMPHSNISFFSDRRWMNKLEPYVRKFVVLITHMHEDHIGGLVNFMYFNLMVLHKELTLVAPSKVLTPLMRYVKLVGGDMDLVNCGIVSDAFMDPNIVARPIKTTHVAGMFSYSYVIYTTKDFLGSEEDFSTMDRWSIFYSGDSAVFMADNEVYIKAFFKDYQHKLVYHDFSTNKLAQVHLKLDALLDASKNNMYRSRIIPMHYDFPNKDNIEMMRKYGFNTSPYDDMDPYNLKWE